MNTLLSRSMLVLCILVATFSTSGCRAARNDARIDKLEQRVTALETKVEMMQKH